MTLRKVAPTATKVNEKNSDKSHGSTDMFPHRFGRFLPLVDHLPSEKFILLDFSSSRVVAVSVPFPEVQIRKGTESGLTLCPWQITLKNNKCCNTAVSAGLC